MPETFEGGPQGEPLDFPLLDFVLLPSEDFGLGSPVLPPEDSGIGSPLQPLEGTDKGLIKFDRDNFRENVPTYGAN